MDSQEPEPTILLLHDGELSEFSDLLESLSGSECCGAPGITERNTSWDLVLGTPKRIIDLHDLLPGNSAIRIAVLDGDSKTMRSMLRRTGAEIIVRRPVHPAALRLLILHSLYNGPERRRKNRVSIGATVQVRARFRRQSAILADLSTTGCRLLAAHGSHPARTDRKLTLMIPPELNDGRPFSVRGDVRRVSPADAGADAIALVFTKLHEKTQEKINNIVTAHRDGPAILGDAATCATRSSGSIVQEGVALVDEMEAGSACSPENAEGATARQMRLDPRREIERRVVALGNEAARVLIGRDLSIGGMRVDPTPGLGVGDELQIALHVPNSKHPLVIGARIARDDGEAGMALQFVDLNDPARLCLEEVLQSLPAISEPSTTDEDVPMIVSEVIRRRAS
jgi:hypothetical protein